MQRSYYDEYVTQTAYTSEPDKYWLSDDSLYTYQVADGEDSKRATAEPTLSPEPLSSPEFSEHSFNTEYQAALDLPEGDTDEMIRKYRALADLATDFAVLYFVWLFKQSVGYCDELWTHHYLRTIRSCRKQNY